MKRKKLHLSMVAKTERAHSVWPRRSGSPRERDLPLPQSDATSVQHVRARACSANAWKGLTITWFLGMCYHAPRSSVPTDSAADPRRQLAFGSNKQYAQQLTLASRYLWKMHESRLWVRRRGEAVSAERGTEDCVAPHSPRPLTNAQVPQSAETEEMLCFRCMCCRPEFRALSDLQCAGDA